VVFQVLKAGSERSMRPSGGMPRQYVSIESFSHARQQAHPPHFLLTNYH
jgi:hypothetical protein